MTIDVAQFKFANNTWIGTISSPTPITFWLKGDADHFNDPKNIQSLESLARGIWTNIDTAIDYAKLSEYARDIADANGLVVDSVYVDDWEDIRIWFSLENGKGRMLGVRVIKSKPVDVFCDEGTFISSLPPLDQ